MIVIRMVVLSAALFTLVPGAARADGVNLIRSDIPVLGCTVTYSMTAEVEKQYGTHMRESLPRISAHTGMTFKQVPVTDDTAQIRYTLSPSLPTPNSDGSFHTLGKANPDGLIQLADVNEVSVILDLQDSAPARINLLTHETLHVLGLGHDMDIGSGVDSDEIMSMTIRTDNTVFGDGDKAGMEAIRATNGCSTAGFEVPPDIYAPTYGMPVSVKGMLLAGGMGIAWAGVAWVRRIQRRKHVAARIAALDAERQRAINDSEARRGDHLKRDR